MTTPTTIKIDNVEYVRADSVKASEPVDPNARPVLVGNEKYGLYIGLTSATDEEISRAKSVTLRECRHVAQWHGKSGGISSLAAYGPCGPKAAESRVGAPCPSALLTGVVNVFTLSSEAVKAFAAIVAE